MRIALFAFHFSEYSFRLGCALTEAGNEVLLFLTRDSALQEIGSEALEKSHPRLQIILQEKRGPKDPRFVFSIWQIRRELDRFEPDVIHYQESLNYAFTLARLTIREKPLVLTIHDHKSHTGARTGRLSEFHKKYLRKLPDAVIVHGNRIRQESEIILPWLKCRIFSIPHGPIGRFVSSGLRDWEIGTVLFFGRVEQYKGLGYLVEAVRILRNQGRNVKVVIAGRGNDLDRYRKDILADPSFELIERFIEKDAVQGLFERANIVVLPYTDATQSGVAAMALQFGRPIVASDVGSISEMVRDGYNGLLVPPCNPKALAGAIDQLIINQKLAKIFGEHSAKLADGELCWTSIAAKTLDVYQIAGKPRN